MARVLDQVFGHQELISKLLERIRTQALPASLLFTGPEGIGRKKVAMGLAQALLCEVDGLACGQCGSCLRIAKGNSESLMILEPEKNQIKIEQIRQVLDFLSLQKISKARVIIIDHAESMNPMAANSLLKSLEEPFAGTYFILIAPSRRHVLATIASRCQMIGFSPLSDEILRKQTHASEWLIKAACGSLGRLESLKEEEEAHQTAVDYLNQWSREPESFLAGAWRNFVRDRQQAMALARFLAMELSNQLRSELANPGPQGQGFEQLQAMAWQALKLEGELKANRDPLMVFEEFWLTAAANKCQRPLVAVR